MREIVLDTETTGLDPKSGHRIVEIGCIELINHVPTGNTYHQYVNPDRDMPDEAFAVHGLSEGFLSDYPVFAEIAEPFMAFVADATLVIHNAAFDMGFINAELAQVNIAAIPMSRTVDTVTMARKKFPGAQASLDALCKRFGVDNQARTKHGALLDADLLASVYIELLGGRQQGLALSAEAEKKSVQQPVDRPFRPARSFPATAEESAAHDAFLGEMSDPVWRR